ncbi:MAG: PAS domain-containing protein [bacterium]|nr:PAS domain-containing protein [bacterium]
MADWKRPEGFWIDIVDAMADPLFVKDEQHRWITVNTAFCKLMGKSRNEILGKSDYDYFPKEEADEFWRRDEEVFRTGEVNINEEPLTDSGGNRHVIVTKKAAITDAAGRRILVGIIRDVTEEKRMEEELRRARDDLELRVEQRTREVEEAQAHLRQAQKMEAVGQLTGGVAHDFNNLLGVISGNLEMARDLADSKQLTSLLDRAMNATTRGAMLIQRLLAFSRRQTLSPRATDVCSLFKEMLDMLSRTLGEAIEIKTHKGGDTCWSCIDPSQFEAAVLNLCINSRDAMPAGGTLSISVSPAVLDAPTAAQYRIQPGPYVAVEISDDGVGMDAATLERAFEPFFTTKDTGKGSGLGLSMVYGFVRQSNGHIKLISAPGAGTKFKMYLPQCDPEEEAATVRAKEPASHPHGKGESVLLVEDDPAVREMTNLLLKGLGYEVHPAGSVDEALKLLPQLERLDLLLTDVMLTGGRSGQEMAAEIRKARPETRIVFMSGYTDNILDAEWLDRGYVLLNKPFRRAKLAETLQRVLQDDPL